MERSGETGSQPQQQALLGAWTVHAYDTLGSTQDVAAAMPAWSAVRAVEQTAGRGTRRRSFVSDNGGLYLTAVLPFDGNSTAWRGFALAVGLSIVEQFQFNGIAHLRLRWPNDLMICERKVGGILVAQGNPDTLCIGMGLNVRNRPWLADPALKATSCRLADFVPDGRLDLDALTLLLLEAVRQAFMSFPHRRLQGLIGALNQSLGGPREVRLEMEGSPEETGLFIGLDPEGDLMLRQPDGSLRRAPHHRVNRLRELQAGAPVSSSPEPVG